MRPHVRGARQRTVRVQPPENAAEPVDRPVGVGVPPARREAPAIGVRERGPRQRVEAVARCRRAEPRRAAPAPRRLPGAEGVGVVVDPGHPDVESGRDIACALDVSGPDARAEPVGRVVRPANHRLLVVFLDNDHSGAEELLGRGCGPRAARRRARSARGTSPAGWSAGRRPPLATVAPCSTASATRPSNRARCSSETSGPSSTSGSARGRSGARRHGPRAARRKSSCSPGGTAIRSIPAHAWPQFANEPHSAPSTARSRSASSRTSIGSLPPSSSTAGRSRSAAACATDRPTSVDPVKTTPPIPRWRTRASPTVSPGPWTTRTSPAGPRRAGRAPRPRGPTAASARTASGRRRCRRRLRRPCGEAAARAESSRA